MMCSKFTRQTNHHKQNYHYVFKEKLIINCGHKLVSLTGICFDNEKKIRFFPVNAYSHKINFKKCLVNCDRDKIMSCKWRYRQNPSRVQGKLVKI